MAKSGTSEGFQTMRMVDLVLLVDADKGLMQLNPSPSSLLVVAPLRWVWQLKGPQNLWPESIAVGVNKDGLQHSKQDVDLQCHLRH